MNGESKVAALNAEKGVRSEYIHGHTIIYRSKQEKYKWTKDIDDIVEILEGELSEEETAKLFKKHMSD
ncbi:MAG: hypothetical protein NTY20_04155 [Candidatus Aenigmarchaeota archaeon]|nr:hypothetical protein [Candidatus Aenigmarchaeota archaeon]